MSSTLERLMVEAMQLPATQRLGLAQRLLDSLPETELLDARWFRETSRRIAAIESGEVELIPYESAMAQIHGLLKQEDQA
jgi:putative addiction module component (TIGR02574 family)